MEKEEDLLHVGIETFMRSHHFALYPRCITQYGEPFGAVNLNV